MHLIAFYWNPIGLADWRKRPLSTVQFSVMEEQADFDGHGSS